MIDKEDPWILQEIFQLIRPCIGSAVESAF